MKLPEKFIEVLGALGNEAYERLGAVIEEGEAVVAVRINRAKGAGAPEGGRPVEWCADGYYLDERPQFTFDPAIHQGLYYVQDASSMAHQAAVAEALKHVESSGPLRYLDACAAPGGKTTAALAALPADAFVVANEFDPRRTSILAENLAKWGRPATITRGDASKIRGLDGFFDIIAADVPCSGEGMMRKDPQAVAQWSPGLVAECASRQGEIVDCLWRALRPGGVLIYSTCTFNTSENEQIVGRLIADHDAEPIAIPALERPEILPAAGGYDFPAYRFVPGRVEGEGQFIAILRKPGDGKTTKTRPAKLAPWKAGKAYLKGDWKYFIDGQKVLALPSAHVDLAQSVAKAMHTVGQGVEVGELKGRDLIPAQQLAMAIDLNRGLYAKVEIDRPQALSYLRREAIALPEGSPRGIVLLTHGARPLGFVKNLGNRANNLYPANWRILSQQK